MDLMVGLIAATWGFGEATVFFFVPDIYLSLVALRDTKAGLVGCAFALGGALLGGTVMYLWGLLDVAGAEAVLDLIPAIDPHMIEGVRRSLTDSGLFAVFLGPLAGTPYKIYAVESGSLGVGLPLFLLVSIPARGVRFVLLTALAAWISRRPLAGWPLNRKRVLGILAWSGFYILYFTVKGL